MTTIAAHVIQSFLSNNQTPVVRQLLTHLISGDIAKKSQIQVRCSSRSVILLTQIFLAINGHYWQAEINSRLRMKVQVLLMQMLFIEIHQVFGKNNKVGYFSNSEVICLLLFSGRLSLWFPFPNIHLYLLSNPSKYNIQLS